MHSFQNHVQCQFHAIVCLHFLRPELTILSALGRKCLELLLLLAHSFVDDDSRPDSPVDVLDGLNWMLELALLSDKHHQRHVERLLHRWNVQ